MARTIAMALGSCMAFGAAVAAAQGLPAGFARTDPILGRTRPVAIQFAHDGRVFVAEQSGRIWVYRNLVDPAPQLFADVSAGVHDFWDRGLLGFALDPRFPETPWVYVQYTSNGGLDLGGPTPRWPSIDCPDPPGATTYGGGCVVSGRLSRLGVEGDSAGVEQVLLEDWYQQFPSHSIGTIAFGPDGFLYAGGGDGASFTGRDFGQWGNAQYPDLRSPLNPLQPGDQETNHGGSLRSQGLEVQDRYAANGNDVWLDGTIVRIDPATGEGAPGNPLAADAWPNARRIIAYGLRNPFRFTFRPGTGEVWLGDVGENVWEEINRIPALPAKGGAPLLNFGWPCYEGRNQHSGFSGPICEALYGEGATLPRTPHTEPWYTYAHAGNSSDITGLAFYTGSSYPVQYRGALFLADNSKTVIFSIPFLDANADGVPDPPNDSSATAFYGGNGAKAVHLTTGPGGDLFYANLESNRISRISYCDGCTNRAPSAAIALDTGSIADGPPRTIGFTAANSVDPDAGDVLAYAWDLDADGGFDDGNGITGSAPFTAVGLHRVTLRLSDGQGGVDEVAMTVGVLDNTADVAVAIDNGLAVVVAGQNVVWTLTVDNTGANALSGVGIGADLPPTLSAVHWTCSATAGSSCAATGSGAPAESADIALGGRVTYAITATVAADAQGSLTVGAHASLPPGYVNQDPVNDSASDTDNIVGDAIFRDGFDSAG